ncbi:replication protein [Candidatus Fukatsuia endosymbiont of Tuberolachnus salignus]|uniref:replication protein n=1 Tax=Candidatus Fukatsuia endosymbiont of Tuberolachnus salignus TaxID=3077957 RepID=UPI00313B04AF
MSQAGQGNDKTIDRQEQRVANIDEGYTRLANELYDELIGVNLTKIQARVAHAVCRKTYGFNKKRDRISDNQLAELTKLPRQKVNKAKNELVSMKVLIKSHNQIGINKNLSEWSIHDCQQKNNIVTETGTTCSRQMCHPNGDFVTEIETRSERQRKGSVVTKTGTENVTKTVTALSPKQGHTKDTITKDKKDSITPISPFGDERVKTIFAFWQKNLAHPQARLDKKRAKRIQARLKEKFSAEDLCQAITGATYDPWLMGKNPENKRYDGIDTVLRDAAQVERLMGLAGNHYAKALAHGKYSATTARNIQNLQSWISGSENTGAPF